jgi:ATP-dependent DNA ligase
MAARDQARRLPHHCPQEGRTGEAYSRPGNDFTRRFPLIVETLARLRSRSCIIDGEAVACDDNGVASFDLICHHRANDRIFLYAFDLIELNGDDLRRDPLAVRKATLASIVAKASQPQWGIRQLIPSGWRSGQSTCRWRVLNPRVREERASDQGEPALKATGSSIAIRMAPVRNLSGA